MQGEQLLKQVRRQMEALTDERFQVATQRFFKEPVIGYGIPCAELRRMAAAIYPEVKAWPLAQRNLFCRRLWESGMSEQGSLAIYLYKRFERQCGVCEFHLFEKWIDRYVTNWGHCDGVALYLLGASVLNEPELSAELPAWTASGNRWKRRAAAVALVYPARRGLQTGKVFQVADGLRRDDDDLARKATGWLLKETYKERPKETVRFLRTGTPPFSRLVLRYAAEKMTAEDRKVVLAGRVKI
ncbi:MAG: DNA alkylation repair protein [Acidobacteriia bacterium]|nr:DNA alkylation repair protein [Terriglobia bacterium]